MGGVDTPSRPTTAGLCANGVVTLLTPTWPSAVGVEARGRSVTVLAGTGEPEAVLGTDTSSSRKPLGLTLLLCSCFCSVIEPSFLILPELEIGTKEGDPADAAGLTLLPLNTPPWPIVSPQFVPLPANFPAASPLCGLPSLCGLPVSSWLEERRVTITEVLLLLLLTFSDTLFLAGAGGGAAEGLGRFRDFETVADFFCGSLKTSSVLLGGSLEACPEVFCGSLKACTGTLSFEAIFCNSLDACPKIFGDSFKFCPAVFKATFPLLFCTAGGVEATATCGGGPALEAR